MSKTKEYNIRDLGVIGDRKTCALVTKDGEFVWYCPQRFDKPAFINSLIDPEKGAYWSFQFKDKKYKNREYTQRSAVLSTQFEGLSLTDFMPLNDRINGICRMFSEGPEDVENDIFLKPYYGLGLPEYEILQNNVISISRSLYLTASHGLSIDKGHIKFTIPKGSKGWAILSDTAFEKGITEANLNSLKLKTLKGWEKIASQIEYTGPYEKQVQDSLRAIQLVTYQENGGIMAAATTSLPEVVGGSRNYDYRYVWLRDSAMIISALIRAESTGEEESKFLSFLCDAKYRNSQKILLPFYSLDKLVAQPETVLPLAGYKNSRPVHIGNNAMDQLQLDANANVLLVAKMIYGRTKEKYHWDTVVGIANFLAENWHREDHGIWEEHLQKHFTSSKVIVAKSLEFIAEHAETEKQKNKWLKAAEKIRDFIKTNCLTKDGAYASYAGSDEVDVTAALFPVWLFTKPDSPEMLKTMELLEKNHRKGKLYHRTLEMFNAFEEGVFLAGCFWVAQYYIMLDNFEKAREIIDTSLEYSNDLGFFAEEADTDKNTMLGNFPQTFVHASFIGAVIDLRQKMTTR
ncbi:glycoside hydrolase family 15 protein [Gramella sp. AN32]|uniref:Glycoside hydrolase family 15 protein n=1 Tax=Christiangramia antarctica TaxID=2058158 RepID=A0ABW5X3W9_9FLAO|nr:glycoside hydrolase family 15 protein [Gramella sp. AN32]MCM4157966.1 glycoside hydrolase family 15 protein [Gramella sp. AN32]